MPGNSRNGRLPDDMSVEDLAVLLHEFITAPTFSGKQHLIEGNPNVLLSNEADSMLAGLGFSYADDETISQALEQHRWLLRRCREIGIHAAFQELYRALEGERPPTQAAAEDEPQVLALVDAIGEFIVATDWQEARRWLDDHPELLSPLADEVFERLIRTHNNRREMNVVRQLIVHRDLLRACREVGVDAAFERMTNPPDTLDIIAENTISVLTDRPDERGNWQEAVRQSRLWAAEQDDRPMLALLRAIDRLLGGESPEDITPGLDGVHADCWARIVSAL